MKHILLITLCFITINSYAQVDTVVVRQDSTFESLFHRKLYDKRTNVKYHLEERGNVRELMVYLATLEELKSGKKMYAVRIDQRLNRNIFTDAPLANAEYIDEDELDTFIGYLRRIMNEIIPTPQTPQRYTEYRFYTRGGIMLECYTGINRWRCLLHYQLGNLPSETYINNPERLRELTDTLVYIRDEIADMRKKEK